MKCFFFWLKVLTAFWHNLSYQPSATKASTTMASATMTSATNSQNLSRTYSKLTKTWDKKTGKRTSEQGVWNQEASPQNPVDHVPYIMSSMFEKKTRTVNMCGALNNIQPEKTKVHNDQIFIYTMRNSDTLPKNVEEEKKLYAFVKMMLRVWCQHEPSRYNMNTLLYLEKNIHICVCFFVWYMTKPNFFFKDKIYKQTTKRGFYRVWTPILLNKEIRTQVSAPTVKSKVMITTTNAQLPKWEGLVADIKGKITTITRSDFSWEDSRTLHNEISEALSDNELNTNQVKKLHKLYHEYLVLHQKISKTKAKIMEAEMANAKMVVHTETESSAASCIGCLQNQPNQLAHVGGCLEDLLDDEESQEMTEKEPEVPDNWEDLF